ncbi:MAG: histidine kinase [Bryobacterales bacterium]|jgi:two-component system LytT family sensor kinase|nr:histidine kinase [Bryobacterales bacterium]
MPNPLLVTLLIKIGVAAAIASFLVRVRFFSRSILREERSYRERLVFAGCLSLLFGASVTVRIVTQGYQAADLGLEGSFLSGLLGGYLVGIVAGPLIALPAVLNGEYFTVVLYAGVATAAALLRDLASDPEQVWQISPFFERSLYRLYFVERDYPTAAYQLLALGILVLSEFLRQLLGQVFGERFLFVLRPEDGPGFHWLLLATYVSTIFAVAIPLKIWNNQRTESKLKEQNQLLMQARLEALSRQINPHFLFNTLNSVSSLIRTNPDQARQVVYRLSHILRRLLKTHEHFVPLREEISFIDDYLAIERVRFGDKLRVEQEIAADVLDCRVPSMLLQPLVENCIRHGLGSKIEGGCVRLSAQRDGDDLRVTVADDGVGMKPEAAASLIGKGIGLTNTHQRLNVLYGGRFLFDIESQEGQGMQIRITVPVTLGEGLRQTMASQRRGGATEAAKPKTQPVP